MSSDNTKNLIYSVKIPELKDENIHCEYFQNNDFFLGRKVNEIRSGLGLLVSSKGIVYEGSWARGIFHGIGYQTYKEGRSYVGEYYQGRKHGVGKLTDKGADYIGEFSNGRRSGIGILKDEKGRVIKGFYSKGVLHGYAFVDVFKAQYSYKGQFEKGYFDGVGEEINRKTKYFGKFSKGKKHGIGFMKSNNGNKFLGNWLFDDRHGFGVEHFRNNDLYEGDFSHNERTGVGRYLYKQNGYYYIGEFDEGKRSGFGKLEGENMLYIGGWRNNKRDGLGYQRLSSGRAYFGYWRGDKRQGLGYEYSDSVEYKGEWDNDKPHGRGVIKLKKSGTQAAVFEKGILTETLKKGVKTILSSFQDLNINNFFQSAEMKVFNFERYIEENREILEGEYKTLKFNVFEIGSLINSKLKIVFDRLDTIFKDIEQSRFNIAKYTEGLKPEQSKDLRRALRKVNVNIGRNKTAFEKFQSDNDHRNTNRGIEKADLTNYQFDKTKKKYLEDEMKIEEYGSKSSHNISLGRNQAEEEYKKNLNNDPLEEKSSSKKFKVGDDYLKYFNRTGKESAVSKLSNRSSKNPTPSHLKTPTRSRREGPDSMDDTFVRDVSTQFNQYNDIDLSKLTSSLRKTPPQVYYEAGNVRKSPSPNKKLRSTLHDSQKLPGGVSSRDYERRKDNEFMSKKYSNRKQRESPYNYTTPGRGIKGMEDQMKDEPGYDRYSEEAGNSERSEKYKSDGVKTPKEEQYFGRKRPPRDDHNDKKSTKKIKGKIPRREDFNEEEDDEVKDDDIKAYPVLAVPFNTNTQPTPLASQRDDKGSEKNPQYSTSTDRAKTINIEVPDVSSVTSGLEDPYSKDRREKRMLKKGPDESENPYTDPVDQTIKTENLGEDEGDFTPPVHKLGNHKEMKMGETPEELKKEFDTEDYKKQLMEDIESKGPKRENIEKIDADLRMTSPREVKQENLEDRKSVV